MKRPISVLSDQGNLHSGNVAVIQGKPSLLDIENYFFGGSGFLRNYAVMLRGPSASLLSFDLYSFGHILFEMSTGSPLHKPNCDGKIPDNLPDTLSKIFFQIIQKMLKTVKKIWVVAKRVSKAKILGAKKCVNLRPNFIFHYLMAKMAFYPCRILVTNLPLFS